MFSSPFEWTLMKRILKNNRRLFLMMGSKVFGRRKKERAMLKKQRIIKYKPPITQA